MSATAAAETAAGTTLSGARQGFLRILRSWYGPALATWRHEATASSWHDNFVLCNQGEPAPQKLPRAVGSREAGRGRLHERFAHRSNQAWRGSCGIAPTKNRPCYQGHMWARC